MPMEELQAQTTKLTSLVVDLRNQFRSDLGVVLPDAPYVPASRRRWWHGQHVARPATHRLAPSEARAHQPPRPRRCPPGHRSAKGKSSCIELLVSVLPLRRVPEDPPAGDRAEEAASPTPERSGGMRDH
jgi:hypothetical protein